MGITVIAETEPAAAVGEIEPSEKDIRQTTATSQLPARGKCYLLQEQVLFCTKRERKR